MIETFNIVEYKDEMYEQMNMFYYSVLYETHHFLPYTPGLHSGKFDSPDRTNLVIFNKEQIIAHGTFVDNGNSIVVGVAVLRDWWSRGLGTQLIIDIIERTKILGKSDVIATIHMSNWRSILLFNKLGFVIEDEIGDNVIVRLPL